MDLQTASDGAPVGSPERSEPRLGVLILFLLVATLLPRLLAFPVNENLHGDAVARTELAMRWAQSPHWISSFKDGAYQFGPLHLYAMGLVLEVWPNVEDAGRAVSLFFGVLSVLPLFFLTRRLFGWKAGVVAGLAFSAWGMQIQMSTTAVSEALGLFFTLMVLANFARTRDEGTMRPLFWAALFLNLDCATRYDAFLLIPLLTGLLAFGDKDRVAALTRAVIFAFLCLPFPAVWLQGNETAMGQALYPIAFIDHFHQTWAAAGIETYGQLGFRLQNLFFWPAMALFTLSPLIATFGMVGMASTWRRVRKHRWLIWVALLPTAYFTFRAVVLVDFVPLGRFTVNQLVLLLPFVSAGFVALASKWSLPVKWGLVGVSALLAIGMPLWLGLFTWQAEQGLAVSLNPVSPVATNPPAVMHAARYLRDHVGPTSASVVLDGDQNYSDLQLAFFSHLPEERLVRVRWENFDQQFALLRPEYLVRIEGGLLDKRADFDSREGRVQLGDAWFEEVPALRPPLHLFQRVRSEEVPPTTGTAADLPRAPVLSSPGIDAPPQDRTPLRPAPQLPPN